GFAELAAVWSEFRWVLGDVQGALESIQVGQAETLALQREQLDVSREHFARLSGRLLEIGALLPLEPENEAVGVGERPPPAGGVACPYVGLRAFQPDDAEYFFGREALVAELLARLAESSLLVVTGPSGSGKSSVVRAGLVPALWAGALPGSECWL